MLLASLFRSALIIDIYADVVRMTVIILVEYRMLSFETLLNCIFLILHVFGYFWDVRKDSMHPFKYLVGRTEHDELILIILVQGLLKSVLLH